ncbi:IucA/IucC family siderophore biosynthesis protein [Vibrio sp. Isolate31]|uniref:IucA/IucC family protein n=1 Tax=unclassified Vibrio TaxID=2614977 RepID=UPI001EFC3455|nr:MULTISPECIES: IucA/IucC family protein [unclassified Vibrio]MCG9554661.1 IucA/IucC family siderophore biosynthesis protein [Vibrio sp. Isolate32]MCG9600049.1 IucA/IucC family siderophore biosynthesis protein [Vibrio sp. Isolate31]
MEQIALHKYWPLANQKMVAKIISEFAYEQAFRFEQDAQGYTLKLANQVSYQFQGSENIWGQVLIEPGSIVRQPQQSISAALLMRDLQSLLNMTDDAFAEHLEDLNATLLGDCKLMQRKEALTARDLALLPCEQQQTYFDGHPKFAFNKGRRGWGSDDLKLYAPESERAFQLGWVAVEHSILQLATNDSVSWQELLNSSMNESERKTLDSIVASYGVDIADYSYVPVHPWQWSNKLSLLFIREMAEKKLIYLGEFGDQFLPQLSLRTLSNITRPDSYDIKLPLTIMNTSCYRGIPGRYILAGPTASDWIESVFSSDQLLVEKQAEVLQEPAAAFAAQADYQLLEQAPYRYHELLGVIWRESAASKLKQGEQAILMAALMESDNQGNPLIAEYIERSGVSVEAWLSTMFDAVVIPYYHLLCKYGVSLIAHGQNVTLVLENDLPKRILLKDFQGDMRLVDSDYPEQAALESSVKEVTVRLEEELIIHDLQTGHFVTTLRFISPLVAKLGFSESQFYALLGQRIKAYMEQQPDYQHRFSKFDLFKPRILRIGLNLAKFRHSTDASASRMLPDMDDMLDNPLVAALQAENKL